MRFVLRGIGTWLLALALILIIIDGTKSLAARELVTTSLEQLWLMVHAHSYNELHLSLGAEFLVSGWQSLKLSLMQWPAWAVFGVPGLIFALMGRSRTSRIQKLDQF